MKLDYFDLISPDGVVVKGIGRIKSPKLKQICEIGIRQWKYEISMLATTPRDYIGALAKVVDENAKNPYDDLPYQEKDKLNMFDIFVSNAETREDLRQALSMFIDSKIEWDNTAKAYLINKEDDGKNIVIDGQINKENFSEVSDMCLQLAYVASDRPENLKFKNERSKKWYYEVFLKRKEKAKKISKADKDYELGNIISAVSTFHNSINMTNVWDMTVYQIHDTFGRQQIKNQVFIHDQNYSVWGGKYEPKAWFERMDKE